MFHGRTIHSNQDPSHTWYTHKAPTMYQVYITVILLEHIYGPGSPVVEGVRSEIMQVKGPRLGINPFSTAVPLWGQIT